MNKTNHKHKYGAKYDFSAGAAGEGYVKLPDGKLHLSATDIAIEGTMLSLPITRNYVANNAVSHNDELPKGMLGEGWKLNIEQYLVHSCEDESNESDNCTYHLIDSENNKHEFITKYYYEYNNIKTYVDKKTIDIAVDGSMTFIADDVCHAVKEEIKSCSNKILHATKHDLNGVKDYEQRADEIVQLDEQIKSYSDHIEEMVERNVELNVQIEQMEKSLEIQTRMLHMHTGKPNAITDEWSASDREQLNTLSANLFQSNISASTNNIEVMTFTHADRLAELNDDFTKLEDDGTVDDISYETKKLKRSRGISVIHYTADYGLYTAKPNDVVGLRSTEFVDKGIATNTAIAEEQRELQNSQHALVEKKSKLDEDLYEEKLNLEIASTKNTLKQYKASIMQGEYSIDESENIVCRTKEKIELYRDKLDTLIKKLISLKNTYPTEIIADGGIMYGFAKKYEYTLTQREINVIGSGAAEIKTHINTYQYQESSYYRLVLIFDSKENQRSINYIGDKVNEIVDNVGSKLEFKYTDSKLAKIVANNGEYVLYCYKAVANSQTALNSVVYSEGTKVDYSYQGTNLVKVLTSAQDDKQYPTQDMLLINYHVYPVQVKELIVKKAVAEVSGVKKKDANGTRIMPTVVAQIITEADRLNDNYMAFDFTDNAVRMFNHVANSVMTFDPATHRVISEYDCLGGTDIAVGSYSIYQSNDDGETISRLTPVVLSKQLGRIELNIGVDYLSTDDFDGELLGDAVCTAYITPEQDVLDYVSFYDNCDGELLGDACCINAKPKGTNGETTIHQEHTRTISKSEIEDYYTKACKYIMTEIFTDSLIYGGYDDKSPINDRVVTVQFYNGANPLGTQINQLITKDYTAIPLTLPSVDWSTLIINVEAININGNMLIKSVRLRACDVITEQYNKDDLLTSKIDSKTGCEVRYFYDINDRLSKQITKWNGIDYITYCEYNQQGKMIKKYLANGIVQQQAVSRDGKTVEELTYSDKSPAVAFISRTTYDDEGRVDKVFTPTGEHFSRSKYTAGSNYESAVVAPNGNIASVGTDKHGYSVQISTDNDGEHIDNKFVYECGMLVSTQHNGFSYNYTYDEYGRTTKIYLDDIKNPYIKYTYGLDSIAVKLASGESYSTEYNKGLPIADSYTGIDGTKVTLAEYEYNSQQMLTDTKIFKNGELSHTDTIDYDMHGRVVNSVVDDVAVSCTYSKDDEVKSNTIDFDGNVKTTEMYYSEDSDRQLTKLDISRVEGLVEYSQAIAYDDLKRLSNIDLTCGETTFTKQYSYLTKGNHTTNNISCERHIAGGKVETNRYTYDMSGNITQVISNNIPTVRYSYDKLNRLSRQDNKGLNKSTIYLYDIGGNITDKYEVDYTLDDIDLSLAKHIPYTYRLNGWKDQLLSYDGGELFKYDDLGNPKVYNGKTATWSHGRQLDNFDGITFGYNADGIRNSKTQNNVTTNYILSGTKVLAESRGTDLIEYHYGADGIIGMTYDGNDFLYRKNISGDISSIFDKNGQECAKYVYDAWGNHQVLAEINGEYIDISNNIDYTNHIGNVNPFRYRGYYFDTESNLYYLNTRYYDPAIGRFINADEITILDETQSDIHGLNLYMYCMNNPVGMIDPSGMKPLKWWQKLLYGIGALIVTAAFVVAVVASAGAVGAIASVGAAAIGLSATTVAAVSTVAIAATYTVAAGIAIFGVSDAIEVWSGGYNPVRELAFNGGQDVYDGFKTALNVLGSVATLAGTFAPKMIQKIAARPPGTLKNSGGKVVGAQRSFNDRAGAWNFRIDATVHTPNNIHQNPHLHYFFRGNKNSIPVYYLWEVIGRWFK